jgi:hypothetical protein
MSQGEDILRAVLELANRHDADAIQAYLAEDMRFRNPITGDSDASGMHAVHSAVFAGFPDVEDRIERMLSQGESGCCGVHGGRNPPGGIRGRAGDRQAHEPARRLLRGGCRWEGDRLAIVLRHRHPDAADRCSPHAGGSRTGLRPTWRCLFPAAARQARGPDRRR